MKLKNVITFFAVLSMTFQSYAASTLNCSSWQHQPAECYAGGEIQSVSVYNQQSSSSCIEGSSFGFEGDSVWVDNGCRADFLVTYAGEEEVVVENENVWVDEDEPTTPSGEGSAAGFLAFLFGAAIITAAVLGSDDDDDHEEIEEDISCDIGRFGKKGRLKETYTGYGYTKKEACRDARQQCRADKNHKQSCSRL